VPAKAFRNARVRAYAKLNLALDVLGKRPDGYHEIRSVFQTVALHDTLEIEFRPARLTAIELDSSVEIAENIVVKATCAVLDATRTSGRVRIQLKKRIPMGGGLGGGSSDAAAVLLTLPVLAGKRLDLAKLLEIGAELGSDVPFFLQGGTALGIGRGEELYPLPEQPSRTVLIVAPQVHVSTPNAYRALNRPSLTSLGAPPKLVTLQSFVWTADPRLLVGANDFEPVVFRQHPELRRWRRKLEQSGALAARMTGSGAALFGIFPGSAELTRALPQFPKESIQVFPTRFLTRTQYRASWLRTLREHVVENEWPPLSRYA